MELKDLREIVAARIARHLHARKSLDIADPTGTAEKMIAKRAEKWLRFFKIVSDDPDVFKTKAEIARAARISDVQCNNYWTSIKGIKVTTAAGEVRVFEDDAEMRFRHTRTVDKGTDRERVVEGGVCLHLAGQKPMSYDAESTITLTTEPALETLRKNYDGSQQRQGLMTAVDAAEQRATARVVTAIRGPRGKQLAMPGTGTDGAE